MYDDGAWSLWFDGTAHGLTASRPRSRRDQRPGALLYFSTLGSTKVPGVPGTADDADIYSWNGTGFARVWDATAQRPVRHGQRGRLRPSERHRLLPVLQPGLDRRAGLGTVQDEDVVRHDGAGWSAYFDGTARGLTADALDVDAFDVS